MSGQVNGAAGALFQEIDRNGQLAVEIARERGTLCTRKYMVAGESVTVVATSEPLLENFTSALVWRLLSNQSLGAADLRIFIWNSYELGLDPPSAPLIHPHWTPRGELQGFCDHRYQSAYLGHANMLVSSDVQEGISHVCITKETKFPSFEIACPLRTSLAWHLRSRNKLMIHAGAVATAAGGALLVGASGAGKSTLALKCLEEDMQFLADDLCAIDVMDPENASKRIYNLYSTAKIFTHEIASVESNIRGSSTQEDDPLVPHPKSRFLVRPRESHLTPPSTTLNAIVQLRRGSSTSRLTEGGKGGVLRILASTTNELLADSGTELMSGLAPVIRSTPVFTLLMSESHHDNVESVQRAIELGAC
jgi:hypothetical protein